MFCYVIITFIYITIVYDYQSTEVSKVNKLQCGAVDHYSALGAEIHSDFVEIMELKYC